MTTNKNHKSTAGFSLIEMIVYISIMTLVLVVVINMMIVIIVSQKKVRSLSAIEHSAIVAFDRMSREIRDASVVNLGQTQSNNLALNTTDDDGNSRTIEFTNSSSTLNFKVNGVVEGPLVGPDTKVTDFSFFTLSDGTVEAVKIELTLEAGENQFKKTETFYSTILLRHVE